MNIKFGRTATELLAVATCSSIGMAISMTRIAARIELFGDTTLRRDGNHSVSGRRTVRRFRVELRSIVSYVPPTARARPSWESPQIVQMRSQCPEWDEKSGRKLVRVTNSVGSE